ncbi:MAG TPA: hypothetical protein EYQ50_05650 [Verrucomicrobiales bacterium]|jgi:hypothetical protein|nr:hypothetical protein [Verrucomicrobiales bacterium]HIL71867.1 hypothetical protein [Verrucomicrobiota bacterium]
MLNSKMVYADLAPVNLVVCGGAALISLHLISRSTNDVDVIGSIKSDKDGQVCLSPEDALTDELLTLVAEIAIDLGIREDWLNPGPSSLIEFGLPQGLEDRLIEKMYGFISRFDQVHLKIFAVMGSESEATKHLNDLLDLEPTAEETQAAVDWLLRRESSADFKLRLKQVLDRIGHERIGEQIQS